MVQVRTLEQNHLTSMQDLAELTDDDLRKLADSSVGLGASLCVCIPAYLSFFLKLCACLKEYQRGVPQCVSVPLAFDASLMTLIKPSRACETTANLVQAHSKRYAKAGKRPQLCCAPYACLSVFQTSNVGGHAGLVPAVT